MSGNYTAMLAKISPLLEYFCVSHPLIANPSLETNGPFATSVVVAANEEWLLTVDQSKKQSWLFGANTPWKRGRLG